MRACSRATARRSTAARPRRWSPPTLSTRRSRIILLRPASTISPSNGGGRRATKRSAVPPSRRRYPTSARFVGHHAALPVQYLTSNFAFVLRSQRPSMDADGEPPRRQLSQEALALFGMRYLPQQARNGVPNHRLAEAIDKDQEFLPGRFGDGGFGGLFMLGGNCYVVGGNSPHAIGSEAPLNFYRRAFNARDEMEVVVRWLGLVVECDLRAGERLSERRAFGQQLREPVGFCHPHRSCTTRKVYADRSQNAASWRRQRAHRSTTTRGQSLLFDAISSAYSRGNSRRRPSWETI